MIVTMPLYLRGREPTIIHGGPYTKKPEEHYGVKMAVEINKPCDVDIPVEDFSRPNEAELIAGLLETVTLLHKGDKPLYVGCMGGTGRTGLFLAALVKAAQPRPYFRIFGGLFWNASNGNRAIDYVRSNYKSHAIETAQQEDFIRYLDVGDVTQHLYKLGLL